MRASASSVLPSALTSRAARVTLVMSCLYGTTGVILTFLPRWLSVERDLNGAEIGAVLALAQCSRIVIGPAIAFWADGAADRRTPMRILAFAAVASYAAFFFLAHNFISLLLLGFLALSMSQAVTPLVEGALLRATALGKFSYGFGRGIGSVSFIIANVAGGILVSRFGVGAVVVWVLSGLAATALTSLLALDRDPPQVHAQAMTRAARAAATHTLIRNRRFITLIVACGLIQGSHAFYYGFSTLVWRAQGVPADMVGFLWGFGVSVEVAFLWSLPFFERRIAPEMLIMLGAAGGVVRWALLGVVSAGPWLWPLQGMHALSFAAAHIGAMRLLYREAPENAAAMAQTLYSTLSSGILLGISTLLSGFLFDRVGALGYWAMALQAGLGGLVALGLFSARGDSGVSATSR
jgi:PPP family 3-phenylpropionic acid transporter